jgi:hypothetical protein
MPATICSMVLANDYINWFDRIAYNNEEPAQPFTLGDGG